jgi:hypothetical protein
MTVATDDHDRGCLQWQHGVSIAIAVTIATVATSPTPATTKSHVSSLELAVSRELSESC